MCKHLSLCFIAVVFVVDSSHRDRVSEAHSELAKLLTEKELRDALLLIFANKQVPGIFLLFPHTVTLSLSLCIKFQLSEPSAMVRVWYKPLNVNVFLMFNAGKISDARVRSRYNNHFLVYDSK